MTSFTQGLSRIDGGRGIGSCDILSGQHQDKMGWIATGPIVANMIKNRNILAPTLGDRLNKPCIHESMNIDSLLAIADISISVNIGTASPKPATSCLIKVDSGKNSCSPVGADVRNCKEIVDIHMGIIRPNVIKVKSEIG